MFTFVLFSLLKNSKKMYFKRTMFDKSSDTDAEDLSMIMVTMGIILSKQSYRAEVGMGSKSQDFWGNSWTKVFTKPSGTS